MNQFQASPAPNTSAETLFPGFPALDPGRLISVAIKRWWLGVLIVGAFVGLATVYMLTATKMFESSAVLYVDPKNESTAFAGIKGANQANWESLDALKSMAEGIRNGTVILRVVDALSLRSDPDFLDGEARDASDAELVKWLGERVDADLRRGTRLIDVSVKDESPVRARELAQAFIDEFQALIREQNLANAQKARELLEKQSEEQLGRVNAAEKKLQTFRKAHPDTSFEETGGLDAAKLADLEAMLSRLSTEVIQRKAEFEQLHGVPEGEPERILEIGEYRNQDHIQKLLLARNQKAAEFFRAQQEYTPGNSIYQAFAADLEGLNLQVEQTARRVGETIERKFRLAEQEEEKLREEIAAQKRRLLEVEEVRTEFRTLKRAVDASYTTYQALLNRINDTDVADGVDETVIRVFSPPLVPSEAVAPKKKVTVVIAGFFGSMVAVAVVLGLGLLDRRLFTRQQVETTLGLAVLAEIPRAFDRNWDLKDSLFVTREPHSLVSEGFRALRTSLSAHTPRSVLITSAQPGEGKSFCAANLALLQAQFGYRTLLVDADFRKPRMAEIFTDPLRGGADEGSIVPQNLCQETVYPNLFLITCGRFAAETGEPMNGEVFASMLWEAYSSFDCVIVDTSPLGMVSDGLTYARHVDAVALVVEAGKTQTAQAERAVAEIRRMRAPLTGCILNGVTETSRERRDYVRESAPAIPRAAQHAPHPVAEPRPVPASS